MKKFMICFSLTMIASLVITISLFAADVAKIGIVDFQKVLETSEAGKRAQVKIKREGKKMEANLKSKSEEFEKLQKKLEREALVMSKEKRDEKEREARIKAYDLKTLQKKYMSDFKGLEAKLVDEIKKEVLDVIEELGKKEGFLLILEKREAGVLYSPKKTDITAKLIKMYNSKKK